ncbi:MAG: BamA/TamA family outer membrane protein [Desulfobacterales bacterium]
MISRATKIFLLWVSLLVLPVVAAADAVPDRFELAAVTFTGVESVSRSALERTLAAQTPPVWKVWAADPVLSAQDLEDDRLRIQQFYRSNGFYQTVVDLSVAVSGPAPDRSTGAPASQNQKLAESGQSPAEALPRVRVTFEIAEGPAVVIDSIDLAIDGPLKGIERAVLLADTHLETGQVFRVAEYEEAKKNITQSLANRGYPFAEVSGKAVVDPAANQAQLSFRVGPGPLTFFGPTTISQEGTAVSEAVIRRALTYTQGQLYDASKVEASRRNLFRLDVFRIAIIQTGEPPAEDGGSVPMRVQLTARDRQSVRLGIGYGTEDKLRLQVGWTYRNLGGQGGLMTLSARSSAINKSVQLAYDQPSFLDARNHLTARAGNELDEPPAYKNRRIFTDVSLNRMLGSHWFMRTGYSLSFNTEESVAADSPVSIPEQQYLDESTRISAVGLEIARDTRNDLLNPKSGSLLAAKIGVAPEFLGSELAYYQPAIDARKLLPVFKGIVLAGRVYLETIQGMQGSTFIPAFKRLYLGGSDTVRGYGYQELPPLDRNGDPIGGQSAFNASVELRFPIYDALSGVTFVDSGLLDLDPFRLEFSDMRYTCGVGLRYDTVIGPIRLDFGYKLNPPTGKDIGDFTDPDGIVGDRWRFYVNIGQAF